MKNIKILLIIALSMSFFSSCKKEHYDVNNVKAINAEGEVMLPLVTTTKSITDFMERFQLDTLISCNDDGSLYYELFYDAPKVVDGSELLKFNDLEFHQHYDVDTNYIQFVIPNIYETVICLPSFPLYFNSDYLDVYEACMRSGRFDFDVQTNINALKKIVVKTSDIKDANGNDLEVEIGTNGSYGFDIGGWYYMTDEANRITLAFDLYVSTEWTNDTDLYLDVDIKGSDLGLREMRGIVNPYVVPGTIDTAFNLFPNNISGQLEIIDARLHISERNYFGVDAELRVDTAIVYADNTETYSVLEPLPLIVPIRTQMTMEEVRNQKFDATVQAHGGRARAAYYFTLNPHGTAEASVADTCVIDLQIGVDIPFAFIASDVRYNDTVDIKLNEVEMPDLIESLNVDLDLTSTLPLNLNGWFYLYDSQNDMITDTLNPEGKLIMASYNEQPTSIEFSVEITEDRLDKVLQSDRLIMMYEVDTDARNVKLNANQKLSLSSKAKVRYKGNVEL